MLNLNWKSTSLRELLFFKSNHIHSKQPKSSLSLFSLFSYRYQAVIKLKNKRRPSCKETNYQVFLLGNKHGLSFIDKLIYDRWLIYTKYTWPQLTFTNNMYCKYKHLLFADRRITYLKFESDKELEWQLKIILADSFKMMEE